MILKNDKNKKELVVQRASEVKPYRQLKIFYLKLLSDIL